MCVPSLYAQYVCCACALMLFNYIQQDWNRLITLQWDGWMCFSTGTSPLYHDVRSKTGLYFHLRIFEKHIELCCFFPSLRQALQLCEFSSNLN